MTLGRTKRSGLTLTPAERRELAPIARWIGSHHDQLQAHVCSAYEAAGLVPSLAEREVRQVAETVSAAVREFLLEGETDPLERMATRLATEHAERAVAFTHLVVCTHTLTEALPDVGSSRALPKLSCLVTALLAEGYGAALEPQLLKGEPVPAASAADGSGERQGFFGLVGSSAPMQQVYRQVEAASRGSGPVFLVGESGTGKELAARAVHQLSGGSAGSLVVVNCATLPRELVESELFGHRKGAYTGAEKAYGGLVRAAAGSLLFLDEITEMAIDTQAKLLRLLEEGAVRPVGTTQEIPVQVRFIASTNRDPQRAIRMGVLREDIYHRLNVHRIETPPLRDHADDIPALVDHFIALLAARGLRRVAGMSGAVQSAFLTYPWPGNVRELRNAVEVAIAAGTADQIVTENLPERLRGLRPSRRTSSAEASIPTIEEAERQLIGRALTATGGNKRRAAELLGISRHRLYDRLRKTSSFPPQN